MNSLPGHPVLIRPLWAALVTCGAALLAVACHSGGIKPTSAAPSTQSAAGVAAAAAAAPVQLAAAKPDTVIPPKPTEVERTALGVFGDTAPVAMIIDPGSTDIPDGPTWDIDVRSYEGQERVAFYVNLFTQSSRARFQERLRQGTRYEPMIRAKLRAGGIPEDMTYLALVESGYDPNAYSSAAAVGMWQFMSSTARDVGLRVDWWVDERRDPARSTDAAIRFIRDLQNQFGSLYLAAAAYNGGPGRVSRGLTRFAEDMAGSAGEDRFFALAEHDYLRSETKNYVPQIIAAALVGKEPIRYGFAYDTLAQYLYDSVQVSAGTALSAVAQAAAVDVGAIRELNPAVLRGMLPPTSDMWIRVPINGPVPVDHISANLSALPDGDRVGYRTVKTAGTESAASIASKAGISSRQLAWYNPGLKSTKKGKLLAGQTVRVPGIATVAAAANVPDPNIERYGSSTVAATKSGSVHIVQRGESLGRIAARYHVSIARLKSLNGMRGDKVVAGQAIRVRAITVARTTSSKAVASKTPAAKKPAAGKKVASSSRTKASKSGTTKKVAAKKAATVKKVSSK